MVETRLLHLTPLTHIRVHLFFIVESVTSKACCGKVCLITQYVSQSKENVKCVSSVFQILCLHLCCIQVHPCTELTCSVIIIDVQSTIFKLSAPISDMLHSHYAINVHLCKLVENFNGETCLPQRNRITPQTYMHVRIPHVIASAHQLFPTSD